MHEEQRNPTANHKLVLGVTEQSPISGLVGRILPNARLIPVAAENTQVDLDAIIVSLDDAPKLPQLYETPVILLGGAADKSLLPEYSISDLVVVEGRVGSETAIDEDALRAVLEATVERKNHTRHALDIFPEIMIDWDRINERLIQAGGSSRSFFEAYEQTCNDHIASVMQRVKSTGDTGDIMRLDEFYVHTNRDEERRALFETHGSIAVLSQAMDLLESPNMGDFAGLVMKGLALAAPTLKDTPYLIEMEKNTHYVLRIPRNPVIYLKLALDNPESVRREVQVLRLLNDNKKKVGADYQLSSPELTFVPPARMSSTLEKLGFYCFGERELPGHKAIDGIFGLEQRVKEFNETQNQAQSELSGAKGASLSDEEIKRYDAKLTGATRVHQAVREQMEATKREVIDSVARSLAFAYFASKTDDGQQVTQQSICKSEEEYISYLELGFFGDEEAVVKGRQARGIKQVEKELDNEHVLAEINGYITDAKNEFGPVVGLMTDSPLGIDTDRTIINQLLEQDGDKTKVHDLDFEFLRRDPILHAFAKTLVLLRKYSNDVVQLKDPILYEREGHKDHVLVAAGENVHQYQIDVANFVNGFARNFETMKETFKGTRATWPLPDPEKIFDQFHAFSAFRGLLYFGYLTRCKEQQPKRKATFDYFTDRGVDNAIYSLHALKERYAGTAKEEKMRRLHQLTTELHDKYVTWRKLE